MESNLNKMLQREKLESSEFIIIIILSVCVCVCVCMCVCVHVYVVYEDTNLYNDMGMT